MKHQHPQRDGVKDIPNVPSDLNKYKSPPIGPVGSVPDQGSGTNRKGGK